MRVHRLPVILLRLILASVRIVSFLALSFAAGGLAAHADGFAGSNTCAGCHAAETAAWTGSDHAWALKEPDADSVLGDFSGATFNRKGQTTRFFTDAGRYMVETVGPDGKVAQYPVRYAVGVRPLQQYLVETEGGRLQALDLVWDTVSRRWFDLYPDQENDAGNGLHWSGSYKNWQARCAECHQTGFDKGYDLKARTYQSHWSELTVSCESCHGASAAHVAAMQATTKAPPASPPPMLALGPGQQGNELAACGPCHARREAFSQKSPPAGSKFSDHYNLALLTPGLYFADGQQDGEVYILGSFLQSKMMARGVTCSNCHEPHSGRLLAEGNAVCTQCHSEAGRADFPTVARKAYDSAAHHRHADGTEAAQCVSCHMPERTYMMVDGRRDHFFRRPDPLQSKAAGAPDACTGCHADKTQAWAAERIAEWFPDADRTWQDRTPFVAFHKGDRSPAVLEALAAYARDPARPAIVRATAAALLRDGGDPAVSDTLAPMLQDPSALMRTAAAGLFRQSAPAAKLAALGPLLSDPARGVRHAAAAELAALDRAGMREGEQDALRKATEEYVASRNANADMPEAHMALAGLALSLRNWGAAVTAFTEATVLDPQLEEAWVMLGRLTLALGDARAAEQYLERGIQYGPRSIALLMERADLAAQGGDDAKAIDGYRRALAIDDARADIWLALASAALRVSDTALVIDASGKAIALEPGNADAHVLAAIAHYLRGNEIQAKAMAAKAREIFPSIQLPRALETLLTRP